MQAFVETAAALFPALEYLSMMQNPCCPSLDSEKEDEQKRYRNLVIFKLPRLLHLDFLDVGPPSPLLQRSTRQHVKNKASF